MNLYFGTSSISEVAALNDSYRRWVLDRAHLLVRKEARLLTYMPIILCFLIGFGGPIGGAYLCVSMFTGDRMVLNICGSQGGAVIGGFLGGWIGSVLLQYRLRSAIRRILAEDEI